ncbi:MAG: PGPGW domain-containing protein [Candidatus Obscuribacterales bacterium]|nr:PGPGW domain-containing protein [Steroidobacteraceae bacterium]
MGQLTYRWARRIAIALVGGTVLLVGIAMLVLPGPGIVVMLIGLGILGAEFAWARHWLQKLKAAGQKVVTGVTNKMSRKDPTKEQP